MARSLDSRVPSHFSSRLAIQVNDVRENFHQCGEERQPLKVRSTLKQPLFDAQSRCGLRPKISIFHTPYITKCKVPALGALFPVGIGQ